MTTIIPLEQVAADQRGAIAAFREKGSKSFQHAESVTQARTNYIASCAANGLAPDPVAAVEDVELDTTGTGFRVRVYDPRTAPETNSPVLIFFHGGGWVIGNLDTHDGVCRRLAARTGYPVVAVDYRLGPDTMFPAGHDDCRAAIEWVRDNAAARNWDAQRLVTVGDSAGGGLATVCAFLPEMLVPGTTVVAQVPLYPMLDQTDAAGYLTRVEEGFPLTKGTLDWFVANYIPADLRADHRVSPLLLAREAAAGQADPELLQQPPALILTLGHDPLAYEGIEYAGLLARGGTEVELVHLPQHAHGLFTNAKIVQTGESFLDRVADFVLRHTA